MIVLFVILVVIVYIYYYYNNNTNIITYCDKYGICKPINVNEFNMIKNLLYMHYLQLIDILPQKDERTKRLKNKFNINSVFEVFPNNRENDTSYTINKGQEMGICIRAHNDIYSVHDFNIIKYVFTHELAHVLSKTEQHTPEFWSNFKWLLYYCYNNHLMTLIDYEKYNDQYCGIEVNYNVYLDDNVIII